MSVLQVHLQDRVIDLTGLILLSPLTIHRIENGFLVQCATGEVASPDGGVVITPFGAIAAPQVSKTKARTVYCHTIDDLQRIVAGFMSLPTAVIPESMGPGPA